LKKYLIKFKNGFDEDNKSKKNKNLTQEEEFSINVLKGN